MGADGGPGDPATHALAQETDLGATFVAARAQVRAALPGMKPAQLAMAVSAAAQLDGGWRTARGAAEDARASSPTEGPAAGGALDPDGSGSGGAQLAGPGWLDAFAAAAAACMAQAEAATQEGRGEGEGQDERQDAVGKQGGWRGRPPAFSLQDVGMVMQVRPLTGGCGGRGLASGLGPWAHVLRSTVAAAGPCTCSPDAITSAPKHASSPYS